MKELYLQYWEFSISGDDVFPSGCSLHLTKKDCNNFIKEIYKDRCSSNIPNEYEKIVGEPVLVSVKDELYSLLEENLSYKLDKTYLTNLIKMKEIIL